jgi:hypothetical protein
MSFLLLFLNDVVVLNVVVLIVVVPNVVVLSVVNEVIGVIEQRMRMRRIIYRVLTLRLGEYIDVDVYVDRCM